MHVGHSPSAQWTPGPAPELAGWISCTSCSQAVAAKLDLPDDLIGYFSLFLVREKEDGAFSCECLWPLLLPPASPACLLPGRGISSEHFHWSPFLFSLTTLCFFRP